MTEEKARRTSYKQLHIAVLSLFVVSGILVYVVSNAIRDANNLLSNSNSTLGFGNVYVLGEAERLRHRDELALMSVAKGIDFTFIDTIAGSSLKRDQLPYMNKQLDPDALGAWRSHVNAWRTMLDSNVLTALFIEDDMDFDIAIRSQLDAIRTALREGSVDKRSDLNVEWDAIWLESCRDRFAADAPTVIAFEDRTVASKEESRSYWPNLLRSYGVNDVTTRLVQTSNTTACLGAYALSRQGAAKLHYAMTRLIERPIEAEINNLIRHGGLTAYAILPPIMSRWRLTGEPNGGFRGDQATSEDHRDPSEGRAWDIRSSGSVRGTLAELL